MVQGGAARASASFGLRLRQGGEPRGQCTSLYYKDFPWDGY